MVGEFGGIANWFDVQVVNEAGLADENGEERVTGAGDAGDGLEGVGVDDFGVVDGGVGLGFNHFAQDGLQVEGIAHAGGEFGACGFERAMQNGGGTALGGIQIRVARREREAIRLADDGADDDFGVEIEVARYLGDDTDLLRVFAAEVGKIWLDDLEQFHDDGGDAAKMAGTRAAFEAVAEPFNGDVSAEVGGVDFGGGGQKEGVDAGGGKFFGIRFEGAGIFGEVFVGAKLFGVDED